MTRGETLRRAGARANIQRTLEHEANHRALSRPSSRRQPFAPMIWHQEVNAAQEGGLIARSTSTVERISQKPATPNGDWHSDRNCQCHRRVSTNRIAWRTLRALSRLADEPRAWDESVRIAIDSKRDLRQPSTRNDGAVCLQNGSAPFRDYRVSAQ